MCRDASSPPRDHDRKHSAETVSQIQYLHIELADKFMDPFTTGMPL